MYDKGFFDEDAIRQRIARRYRRRTVFVLHLLTYIVVMMGVWSSFTPDAMLAHSIPMAMIWTPLVVAHLLYLLFQEAQERAVQREIERERAWFYQHRQTGEEIGYERLMLSEDGEVLEVVADEKPKRGANWE